MRHLADQEIETGINYIPNHFHPYFRASGAALPETEQAFSEILTLPLHCRLTDEDVTEVITSVHAFFGAGGRTAQ